MSPLADHIVILVPRDALTSPPPWLTDAFTVVNGGQHAGGATANQLILLADGVYLELIAFVGTDEGREQHRWGAQSEGHIIDWALSLAGDEAETDKEFAAIQAQVEAAGVGLTYGNLVPGGRTRPDGVVLKWATAGPRNGDDEVVGLLPFWCLDRTQRKFRVPFAENDGALARHSSEAVGLAGVTIRVADAALLARLRNAYDAILPRTAVDEWQLGVPASTRLAWLRLLSLDAALEGQKGSIELALVTSGTTGAVGGHFVDGWRFEIRLEK